MDLRPIPTGNTRLEVPPTRQERCQCNCHPRSRVLHHMIKLLLWLLLFVLCWPLALLALVLWPLIWLLLLPFRIVGIAVEGVFQFLKAVLFLPARLLGGRP
jgi:hypothetical protein